MPNKGRHEFSVQEAVNTSSFVSLSYEVLDLNVDDDGGGSETTSSETCEHITEQNPAKKVVIYDTPGNALANGFLDDDDVLSLQINGETSEKKTILIDASDLPFTLSGLSVTGLTVINSNFAGGPDPGSNNKVSVLAFH